MVRLASAVAALLLAACVAPGASMVRMPHTDDGGRYAGRVPDPLVDRCASLQERRAACERERAQALEWARRLSVGDELCLAGQPMSDGVTRRCTVRAFVEDVASGKVKLEIREAAVGTPFKPMQDLWYTEAALADAWLESLGY